MNDKIQPDVYKGNNAADYQPPTTNPQITGTNLQPGASGSQPTTGQNDITQQRLPAVDGLKVIVIQDGASTTTAGLTPAQAATQTWMGPFWGSVILGLIIIIIWAVKVLAKEEAPKLAEAIEEAINEPLLAEETTQPEKAVPVKKKKTVKKPPLKKAAKKKSKRK